MAWTQEVKLCREDQWVQNPQVLAWEWNRVLGVLACVLEEVSCLMALVYVLGDESCWGLGQESVIALYCIAK